MSATDNALRIAVAEQMGWKNIIKCPGFAEPRKFPRGVPPDRDPRTWGSEQLPNYLGSLDACAEFEDSLTDVQMDEYSLQLCKLTKVPYKPLHSHNLFAVIRSTARQRCLAYLMTIAPQKIKEIQG